MSNVCMLYPDGSIGNIDDLEERFHGVDSDKRIFDDDITLFMKHSQIGVCASEGHSTYFVPISKMLGWEESLKDHAMAIRDLGKKVKKLEKVKED